MLQTPTEDPKVSHDLLRACHSGELRKVRTVVEKYGIRDWSDFRAESGDTALHVAAREGNMNLVRYLCEQFDMPSFKFNVANKDMKRPLHEAAQFALKKFAPEIVQYLLDNGALVDALKRGDWTPLMLACTKSGPTAHQTISVLLAANANAHLRNKDGWTPFLIACRTGDENVINTLLKYFPQCIDDRSYNGRSALHIAAFHGHERVINLLVASNADLLNAQDSSGSSPLHAAMKHENLNAAKCIIHLGADVNLVDKIGQTILHVATLTGNINAVDYILEHNLIDVNCEAAFGITPLKIAQRNNHVDIIKILTRNGAK
ncbi:ankyrin repeat domain-containing protein 16 [Monomorium pharaonis]|uniref:ankyrin repeat domain-containing protein 16 n=1 Tax=Monomorium pharaonis TaxID=307658 RepID=UPI0017478E20|nr:ankyrin repeat domain-containing protein 16 [Monomorium pharaonis]